jgi:short subunit dehydrogenase-like uncharacterized protein
MPGPLLVYGAYGYTGALVAREAARRGLPLVVAGRDGARLGALALELGATARAFDLADAAAVRRGIAGVAAVLHCAGPFVHTWRPVVDACLAAGVHYLDVTGELSVFRAIGARSAEAERAGVMLLPGAGFDVVPSDCLAAHLARRLPGATRITLAFQGLGRMSGGTARTLLTHLGEAPPPGPAQETFDFGRGPRPCVAIPWGDLATAPRSTGVADVRTYLATPAGRRLAMRALPLVAPLLARVPRARDVGVRLLTGGAAGPSPEERARGATYHVGVAEDGRGARVVTRQSGPEAYALTALAAVELARRVLAGEVTPGWQTPASAYGPDLVMVLPGVTRTDVA